MLTASQGWFTTFVFGLPEERQLFKKHYQTGVSDLVDEAFELPLSLSPFPLLSLSPYHVITLSPYRSIPLSPYPPRR
jgi:hypothetical protein